MKITKTQDIHLQFPPDITAQVAQIMRQISTTHKPVYDAVDMGDYQESIDELNSVASQGLIDEINAMIAALAAQDSRLAAKLAEDEQEQEQSKLDEKYFTVDAKGKRLIRLYSIGEIYQAPDADYLIARILEAASVSLLLAYQEPEKRSLHYTSLYASLMAFPGIDAESGQA